MSVLSRRLLAVVALLFAALTAAPAIASAGETPLSADEWYTEVTNLVTDGLLTEGKSSKPISVLARQYPIYRSDLTTAVECHPIYFSDNATVTMALEAMQRANLKPATFGQEIFCMRKHRMDQDWSDHIILALGTPPGVPKIPCIVLSGRFAVFGETLSRSEGFERIFGFLGVRAIPHRAPQPPIVS